MALSEIWILSDQGQPLLCKKYRQDVTINSNEEFFNIIQRTPPEDLEPVVVIKNVKLFHIKRQNVYFMATAVNNVSSVFVVDLLSRLYQLCKDFCGIVTEESISKNFILIHEILDELLDYGFVQLASTEKIKPYIQSAPVMTRTMDTLLPGLFGAEHRIAPSHAASKSVIKSRHDQQKRKKYRLVDVIEKIVAVVDTKGVAQRCQVQGSLNMKTFLSGSPQVKVMFNESLVVDRETVKGYGKQIYLEDVKFHSCVQVKDMSKDKVITVQPPEGEFSAMTYKVSGNLVHGLPLRLYSYVQKNPASRDLEVGLKLRCEIPSSSVAVNVVLQLPVPKTVKSVSQQLGGPDHTADFSAKKSTLEWKIKRILGKTEVSAHFKLIEGGVTDSCQLELGPVSLDFEISGFLCSNLQVKQLRVEERDATQTPAKWVRYITTPDSYLIKLH